MTQTGTSPSSPSNPSSAASPSSPASPSNSAKAANSTSTFRGFATLSFFAEDHEAAKRWYAELFGIEPYFERPGYAEFRIGDHEDEIGLVDSRYAPHGAAGSTAAVAPAGAFMYWHVDDLEGTLERLVSLGATPLQPITERGHGFVTAAVTDPFGNIVGIMHNPHYLEIMNSAS